MVHSHAICFSGVLLFLYIGATDLIPELDSERCPGRGAPAGPAEQSIQLAAFLAGLSVLLGIALV